MNPKTLSMALGALLLVVVPATIVSARGFGGGFRGGGMGGFHGGGMGGFRGGEMGGFRGGEMGGFRGGEMSGFRGGEMSGFRGGEMGGFRGGEMGGVSGFGHTPSFSSPGSFDRSGSLYGGRNPYEMGGMSTRSGGFAEGAAGGRVGYGARSGSYTTARGGTVDYGAAGGGVRGPEGGVAGRGVAGAQVTTAGGRSFTDVGRAGGAVGPGGAAVGGRSNVAVASGPRGTAVDASRSGFAGRSYGAGGGWGWHNAAYGGYHQGWVHGYWNGHDAAAWGWRGPYWGGVGWGVAGLGLGLGLGWGLSSWGMGSALYGMGYMPYANPYYAAPMMVAGAPAMTAGYNYAQPIDTVSAAPDENVTDPAMTKFAAARDAFKQGNYDQALQQTNEALTKLPNDSDIHEFRALCLFALGRYDEAAATLYAVLSVGPGWDWTTLIGLYPDVSVYTAQLRALESYCVAHPDSAPAYFTLGYQYLTEGHTETAVNVLRRVVALKPSDSLSAKLVRQLDPSQDKPAATTTTVAATPPAHTTPPPGASIAGTWNAQPAAGTAITLTLQPGGDFTWRVNQNGKTQQFTGASSFGDGILTLAQDKGPALVGRVSWNDPSHMTFRIAGDGPDDPGLRFAK